MTSIRYYDCNFKTKNIDWKSSWIDNEKPILFLIRKCGTIRSKNVSMWKTSNGKDNETFLRSMVMTANVRDKI